MGAETLTGTPSEQLFDQAARDVADGDVLFLNALGIARRNVQQQVGLSRQRPSGLSRESYAIRFQRHCGIHPSQNIGACAAGGKGHQNVLLIDHGLYLARKNPFEAVIVASRDQDRRVSGRRSLAQNDFVAVACDAPSGIARIDHQLGCVNNPAEIVAGMIRGDNHCVVAGQSLRT